MDSIYDLDFPSKKRNIRGLLIDIDNTLVGWDKKADEKLIGWFYRAKEEGFSLYLSNNTRISGRFKEDLVSAIHKALKPLSSPFVSVRLWAWKKAKLP